MDFDYFYGRGADQFAFYQIPKILITDEKFAGITMESKILYSLMLDRASLSAKNGWLDEDGRVFIYYKLDRIMTDMHCANQKATKMLKELEEKAGLIERQKQGQGKPTKIYVKDFATGLHDNGPDRRFLTHENHDSETNENHESRNVIITDPDSWKSCTNNTNYNNTDFNNTNLINLSAESASPRMRMAATRLITMHQNKGKSVAKSLSDRTDYAKNGEKTENGQFISSYACQAESVDEEFMLSKREYERLTGRHPRGNIIAYQIRQSFKPGEITPEEANQVGYETAMRFTKGNHAFIVATHTDKAHIHNHIIFNSTSLDSTHKFRDFFFVGLALQRLSDIICLEHGLSVIEKKKPSERVKRTTYPEKKSFRDDIREAINQILKEGSAKDFNELLYKLEDAGYEINVSGRIKPALFGS